VFSLMNHAWIVAWDSIVPATVGLARNGSPRTYRAGGGFDFSIAKALQEETYMDQHDDDTFENGVLRDGARHRVPIQMRDGQAH
jgi:hypothetical protein